MTVVHWDDAEPRRQERGHIAGVWRDLGTAAGSVAVGVKRIEVEPGKWSTPAHSEGAEEEIFFVLGGSGLSWQDGKVYEVSGGDCLVHLALEEEHTLRAGPDGLDVLAFGERSLGGGTILPRAGVAWLSWSWVEVGGGEPPWTREAAAGEPDVGEVSERPFRAGDRGLTLLAYGTRDPNDIVYYPRSNKVSLRGAGVIARLEHVDYWDGEL